VSEVKKLPSSWLEIPLSEVIQTQKGKKPKDLGEITELRTIPYINIKAFEKKIITEYAPEQNAVKCNDDDILLVWDGARSGLSGRGIAGYVGSTLARVRSDLVNVHFLSYFFESIYRILNTQTKGVGIPHINPVVLNNLPFYLPPEAEQPRIVEKLDELFSELDAGVKELKAAQIKLTQYRQSLLKSAVEGSFTQTWRETNSDSNQETGEQLLERILKERREKWEQQKREEFKAKGKKPPKDWQDKYPKPVKPDTTDLPELPKGWVWATIDQLAVNKRYGSSSKTNDDSSGVPVLRMGNIQDGKLDYGKLKYLPVNHKEFPDLLLKDGDLLFNRTNSAELVGKTAIYREIGKPVSYASYLISVTFSEHFLPEIAAHYINSVLGKKWLAEVMNQTAGQANVNGTKLGDLAIPLPSIAEQKTLIEEITNEFDSIDRQVEATAFGLKQSEAQRKNILKSAFSGQLVQQDPSDEPASVLLEKIKQEREELAKVAKPRTPRPPKKKVNLMKTLLEILTSENEFIDAQVAFSKCGIADGSSTNRIEEIYIELRKLEKEGRIKIKRSGGYDQLKLIKQEVKED
jgi:type I restriction enzyme S subunit